MSALPHSHYLFFLEKSSYFTTWALKSSGTHPPDATKKTELSARASSLSDNRRAKALSLLFKFRVVKENLRWNQILDTCISLWKWLGLWMFRISSSRGECSPIINILFEFSEPYWEQRSQVSRGKFCICLSHSFLWSRWERRTQAP